MEEKKRLISILRALLVSNGKKEIPFRELKQDYCRNEGDREIPTFGHKSVIDFLISTGEFIINTNPNGLVMIREKPKLQSLHIKNFVTEQKYSAKLNSRLATKVSDNRRGEQKLEYPPIEPFMAKQKSSINSPDAVRSPDHLSKPSIVFSEMTSNLYTEPKLHNERQLAGDQLQQRGGRAFQAANRINYHDKGSFIQKTNSSYGDTASNKKCTSSTGFILPTDSFNKLNNMCISFYKSLTCDARNNYKAMLQIDSVKYFGIGKSSEEANEDAANQYLKSIDIGTQQNVVDFRKPLKEVAPNSSFIALNNMHRGLHYQTIGQDKNGVYKAVVQVESINYYGSGKSSKSAANNAAETCLKAMDCSIRSQLSDYSNVNL